jgi:hypothetical protein
VFSAVLQGYQVLDIMAGHHPLDPLLWASILKDRKLSGILVTSSWVVWIHDKLQLDLLRLVCIRPMNLFHLLHLGNQKNVGVFPRTEGGKAVKYLKNILMAIIWIEILQQKSDQTVLC